MGDLPIQTPSEEFTERVGETAAGTIVVPHLIATDDYRRNQHAARKAVADTRRIMRKMMMDGAGMTEADMPDTSDEMGDIIYTGDIVVRPGTEVQLGNSRIKVEETPPPPAPTPAPVSPPVAPVTPASTSTTSTTFIDRARVGLRNFVVPALLGAGAVTAGAAGMAIYNYATDKPESVTNITPVGDDEELRVGIHLDN